MPEKPHGVWEMNSNNLTCWFTSVFGDFFRILCANDCHSNPRYIPSFYLFRRPYNPPLVNTRIEAYSLYLTNVLILFSTLEMTVSTFYYYVSHVPICIRYHHRDEGIIIFSAGLVGGVIIGSGFERI